MIADYLTISKILTYRWVIFGPPKWVTFGLLKLLTTTPKRRVDIKVGVSYADNLRIVEKVTKNALSNIDQRIKSFDIEVFFEEFDASSINFTARFWIFYPGNNSYLKARHEAIIKIKEAFEQNDITIPFPIRTLDFGIKGGVSLKESPLTVNKSTQSFNKNEG